MDDQPKKKSGCLLYGCIGAVVLMILVGVGGFFGAKKMMGVVAEELYTDISGQMQDMDMSEAEQTEANELLQKLRDGMKSGDVGFSDLETLVTGVEESKLKEYALLLTSRKAIDGNADLSDEEKANGKQQVTRFADGLSQNRFGGNEFDDLVATISTESESGGLRVKDSPTADELRAMISKAQTLADEANLDADGGSIDFVGELRTLVDNVMGPE